MMKTYRLVQVIGLLAMLLGRQAEASKVRDAEEIWDASGKYLAADYASKHMRLDSASYFLTEVLKEDPENLTLLKQAYLSYLYAGDVPQSAHYASIYDQKMPKQLLPKLLMAVHLLQLEDYKRSNLMAKSALNIKQADAKAASIHHIILPYVVLWSQAGQRDYPAAIRSIQDLLTAAKEPEPFLLFQAALIYDLAGNQHMAMVYYEKVMTSKVVPYQYVKFAAHFFERYQDVERAQELYQTYIQSHPNANYFQKDIERLKRKEFLTGTLLMTPSEGLSEVFIEAARVFYAAQVYDYALAYLQLALFLSPTHHDGILRLASYYEHMKQYKEANAIYERIPQDHDLYLIAQIYKEENRFKQGNKRDAIKQLNRLAEDEQVRYFALLILGDLLRLDGQFKPAIKAYSALLDHIGPKLSQDDWLVYFSRGVCYERTDQWENAENDFLVSLKLNPNQPEVLNYLGYSWIDKGKNMDKAKAMLELAINQRPDDAQIVDSMGWALFKLQEYDKAVSYIEQALDLLPQDPLINEHLGDVYWQQGRHLEARFQWNKALRFASKDLDIDQVRQKLKEGL